MKKILLSLPFFVSVTLFNVAVFLPDAALAQASRPNIQSTPGASRSVKILRPRVFQNTSFLSKPTTVSTGGAAKNNSNTVPNVAVLERRVLEMINQKRMQFGLQPIGWSSDAARVARSHSQNMAAYNFFSHRGKDGSQVTDRAAAAGLKKRHALGENIAYNRGFGSPLESAVQSWMNSPGHRKNLLNDRWEKSGVGIAVTANGTYYFTQVFLGN